MQNEFLIELQAKLDEAKSKTNINDDIEKIQKQLDKLKIQADIDPQTISNLTKQLESIVNQQLTISNINVNQGQVSKAGQQIGDAINKGIANSSDKINNTIKSITDLTDFSKLHKSIINIDVDASKLENYKNILDNVKETYANFGQVKITNEKFTNGVLEKFKVNIEQVNGDLKETKSFIMSLNDNKDTFVFDGLISGSESVVQHLDQTKNAINQTADAINTYKEKAQLDNISLSIDNGYGISDYQNRIDNLINSFKKYGISVEQAATETNSLQEIFNNMKGLSGQDLINQAEQFEQEFKAVKISVDNAKLSFDRLMQPISSTQQVNLTSKIEKWLNKNTRATKEARSELELYLEELRSGQVTKGRYAEINNGLTVIDTQMRSMGKLGNSFFHSLSEGAKKITSWISATAIVTKAITTVRQSITTIKELDTALVDLKKTAKMPESELTDFYLSANNTAKQMGVTTKEIIEQAAAWSRLGFSTADAATKMAKYSSMFATISPGMSLDSATDGLVSVMKAFKIGLEYTDEVVDGIMSKINIIGNTQAVNNSDIVDFLIRSSSAMAEANNTLEDTIALGTAMTEITRDAAGAGQVLKTVSMRIRGYDEETEEFIGGVEELSGKIADLTKTATTPGGISLFSDEAKTEYKSTRQLLQEISEIYDELSDKNQAELLEALAGKRNGQAIAAILNNFDTVKSSLESMANSAGNAEAEMAVAMDSIDYKLNTVKETGTGIAQNLFGREDIKLVLDAIHSLGNGLDWITEKLGLFGTAGIGIAGFLGRDKSKQRFCPLWA